MNLTPEQQTAYYDHLNALITAAMAASTGTCEDIARAALLHIGEQAVNPYADEVDYSEFRYVLRLLLPGLVNGF